jgi:hypothetical protein
MPSKTSVILRSARQGASRRTQAAVAANLNAAQKDLVILRSARQGASRRTQTADAANLNAAQKTSSS